MPHIAPALAPITYPTYPLPGWQAQPLTQEQYDKLKMSCERWKVPFDPAHYRTWSTTATFTPGFAEGWVGGNDYAGKTIYLGVEPGGRSHS